MAKAFARGERADLTVKQMAAIEQALDEIREASSRLRPKDWVMVANGTLLSLIANDVVPASVIHGIFNVLIAGLGHIFGVGGPPPIIAP